MTTKYRSPKTTVVGIVSRNNNEEILLTRRNVEPYKGKWCFPGGHIDLNELVADAVVREVREETGLLYTAEFCFYYDEIIPEKDIHAVVMVFSGESEGELKICEAEVQEAKWVSPEEALTYEMAFEHHQILAKFQKGLFQTHLATRPPSLDALENPEI